MYTEEKNGWHSIHIFIHDFQSHDLFIKKYLTPYIKKNQSIKSHFFIRYWQGGPHIRFRFKADNNQYIYKEIQALVDTFSNNYHPKMTVTAEKFYDSQKFDGTQPEPDELYWIDDLSVCFIPYFPEIERYGKDEQMALNEQLFEYSSILSEELIQLLPENHLLLKLLISWTLFGKLDKFLESLHYESIGELYKQFWSFQIRDTVNYDKIYQSLINLDNKFDSSTLLCPLIVQYGQKISELLNELSKITEPMFFRYMMMSQIHMFNNRLGLPPEFEHLLGNRIVTRRRGKNEMVI